MQIVHIAVSYMYFNHFIHGVLILAGKVGSKNKEDAPYELESQFVLRLPSVRLVYVESHCYGITCDLLLKLMWINLLFFYRSMPQQ